MPPRTRKISRLLALRNALVTHRRERIDEDFKVEALGAGDPNDRGIEILARNRAHHQRFRRGDDYRSGESPHRIERGELRGLHIGRRRDRGERLQLPSAQQMHSARGNVGIDRFAEEERQLMRERLRLRGERGDGDDRARHTQGGLAQHQRIGGAAQAHQRKTSIAVRFQPRFEFARRFFQASFQ